MSSRSRIRRNSLIVNFKLENSEKVKQILKISKEPISLEAPVGEEEDGKFGDFVADTNAPTPVDNIMKDDLKGQIQLISETLNNVKSDTEGQQNIISQITKCREQNRMHAVRFTIIVSK